MIKKLFEMIFGTASERMLKIHRPVLDQINALEEGVKALPDEEFPRRTAALKALVAERFAAIDISENEEHLRDARKEREIEILNEFLPEAFALCREAARRAIGLRHFDVQMLGGMILHNGSIAEMRTGEGKTLVATAPAYLNALVGRGVHIVTVNDYLAKRDSEWMGPVYKFLGLTVGCCQHDIPNDVRKAAYECDITFVTNNEIGFDYLRDNMVVRKEDRVLRPLYYSIIDEVDSILVDEARTPLIISGAAEKSTERYAIVNRLIPHLKVRMITEEDEIQAKYAGTDLQKGWDAIVDEKNHTAILTDEGVQKCEKLLGLGNLYDDLEGEWVHHITQALRAHHLYKRDDEYVIKDGEIIIVDEFTGRLMPGRRWSDGLHQAVEAKEMLAPKEENQTLATITFQNFFKIYKKRSGMTGTAMTEEDEFLEIYKMAVCEIPTNRELVREDFPDLVYKSEREKFNAIVEEIRELWKLGRPVLVGTRSIEKSEKLSSILRHAGIPHQVLNAKYHEMESQIIAQAGRKSAVTIATNMAGRGTDILLGGTPQDPAEFEFVKSVGGLHVLGTERHESRRIDNQLRGRCGRQGDPGSTRFYLALDDELMRLFGSDRIAPLMEKLGMQEGEVIESGLVSYQIENAQRRVETQNFDIRKQLLDYDNVMNKQREVIYKLRDEVLFGASVSAQAKAMIEEDAAEAVAVAAAGRDDAHDWDIPSLSAYLERAFGLQWTPSEADLSRLSAQSLTKDLVAAALEVYARRPAEFSGWDFREVEKMILLQMIDKAWKGHLYDLDHLKKSIFLRAYGQKDPKVEYQKESFRMFEAMLARIREQTVEYLFKVEAPKAPPPPRIPETPPAGEAIDGMLEEPSARSVQPAKPAAAPRSILSGGSGGLPDIQKIGRNDPCFCGSGKKYKKCHGAGSDS
ncbi:MAG: preprotein translocase subunit SecA [Elusimicrobia bacterium RIFOXYD12_FULL_66_9]|nr:MAG: preprotein translocase subunit SecA [Elusimicrobia bacterium RIFOXYD12_FULL_66_9]